MRCRCRSEAPDQRTLPQEKQRSRETETQTAMLYSLLLMEFLGFVPE